MAGITSYAIAGISSVGKGIFVPSLDIGADPTMSIEFAGIELIFPVSGLTWDSGYSGAELH